MLDETFEPVKALAPDGNTRTEPSVPNLWTLFREGIQNFFDDNALTRGAAIAFYAVTALAPVLFIATAVAALGLGESAASGAVAYELRHIMSPQSAELMEQAILHVRRIHHSLAGTIAGVIALIITASGFFTEIEDALNVIWKAPRHESYLYGLLRGRVLSLVLVVGMGLLLLISMCVVTAIRLMGELLDSYVPISNLVIGTVNWGLSFVLVSLLFAAIYKVLPNKNLLWRDVIVASCSTAVLFELGQTAIGYYLANFISANIYGAAGGVIVLLIWVYYAAQIFLLGAELARVWSLHYGTLHQI